MKRNRKHELRYLSAEIQDDSTLVGYATVWNDETELAPGYLEKFAPYAFSKHLTTNPDVIAVFNHSEDKLLGRTASGTLRLREDEKGLWVEIDLPDTELAKEIKELVSRGDLNGMSFRFHALDETFDTLPDGSTLRTVLEAEIYDVSVVTVPAYRNTSVELRSSFEAFESHRRAQIKRALRAKLQLFPESNKL